MINSPTWSLEQHILKIESMENELDAQLLHRELLDFWNTTGKGQSQYCDLMEIAHLLSDNRVFNVVFEAEKERRPALISSYYLSTLIE